MVVKSNVITFQLFFVVYGHYYIIFIKFRRLGEIFMDRQRQGLIIWLYSLKQAKSLRKYGNIHYVSKRLKYVVLYCDAEEINELMEKIQSYSFVKKVEPSYRPFVKTEYENSKPDKAKEYDYKMGF